MHLFIKDACNWSKVTVKTFIMLQINAVLLNFLFICESWKIKCITVSTNISVSTTVFNIDNNQKYFLSSKSAYYYDFWRSCDTEDCSNDAENTAAHHRNKLHCYRYSHRKHLYLNDNNISKYLLYFWSNTCSLGEQKRRRSKIQKIQLYQTFDR